MNDYRKYLFDILDAIEAIENIKLQLPDYQTFHQNRILRSATERELLLIGEAVANIIKSNPGLPITDLIKIKDTRNIIIHDYDGINYKIIWNIIQVHLPILKSEAQAILNAHN
jgi:uncharacterized protein with HEPN domain